MLNHARRRDRPRPERRFRPGTSGNGRSLETAQTTVTTGASRATVQIEPEARTRIKSYVTEHKIRPVTVKERIAVGATVPSDVELVAVPSDWGPFCWWIMAAAR